MSNYVPRLKIGDSVRVMQAGTKPDFLQNKVGVIVSRSGDWCRVRLDGVELARDFDACELMKEVPRE